MPTQKPDIDMPESLVRANRPQPHSVDSADPAAGEKDARLELIKSIAVELESRLVFSTLNRDVGYTTIEQICKAASASREQLDRWCDQVRELVDRVINCAVERPGEGQHSADFVDKQLTQVRQKLLHEVSFPEKPPLIVDFKFADLPPDKAYAQAQRILRDECAKFSAALLQLLADLQTRLILG